MTPEQVAAAMPQIEAHVAMGLLVFPARQRAGTKVPAESGWQSKVWDLGMLERALLQVPYYGLTQPKANPRRLVLLDLDDGRSGLQPGQTRWQDRWKAIAGVPPTKVTMTPSGGAHAWFVWPEDAPMPKATWQGFTVRSLHGAKNWVVGPGSVREDGRVYENLYPDRVIATMPVELARAGMPERVITVTGDDRPERLTTRPEILALAGRLRFAGATGPDIEATLLAWLADGRIYDSDPAEPWTADHLRSIARDMGAKAPGSWTDTVALDLTRKVPAADAPRGIDAADLLAMDLPPLRMIVPDLLAEGTTVIASPPKVGKSCLVYQIAVAVALGGDVLGRRAEPGSVLYYALEDGARRGQARLGAALAGRTMPGGRLEVRWSAPPIGAGLENELGEWLDEHPDAAVVAIDTLQKVRQPTTGKRGSYEVDVEDLGRLQAMFRDRQVALLIVHHSRKDAGDDFLASVSGTYGITGSADSIVVIKRVRLEAFGTIRATGRDIPEAEIPVRFDGMLWDSAPGALPEASFERQEVYRAIAEHGPIFPSAIAKLLDTTRQNVQNMVTALHSSGAIARTSGGWEVARQSLISPVSLMYGGDIADSGGTRARNDAPVNLMTEARRIYGDELVAPDDIDSDIAAAFPLPGMAS